MLANTAGGVLKMLLRSSAAEGHALWSYSVFAVGFAVVVALVFADREIQAAGFFTLFTANLVTGRPRNRRMT